MAQDKKSNPSNASSDSTPQGEKEALHGDNSNGIDNPKIDGKSTGAKKPQNESADPLSKLASEVKQSRANEKQTATPKAKSANPPSSPALSSANNGNKKASNWLAIFALLFSVAASALVGFFWWQSQVWLENQQQLDQLKQQNLISTQQTLSELQAKVSQLQRVSEQKLNQAENSNKSVNDALSSLAARVKELGQSQPNYWLAAEAGYLINLAERRLLVEQDVNTTIQLLLDANQRLSAMQNPSVFHIREAISEDIASLYSIKQPESDDVYLAISGLINEVQLIKFAQVYIPKPNTSSDAQPKVSDQAGDFLDNLLISVKRFFGNFITITRRDAKVQPQLPADQQWFVRANLTTQMLMAQNAVVNKNQAVYNDALIQTQQWLAQYFDTDNARVIAVIATLIELQRKDVGLVLPTGLTAQPLIDNFLKQQIALKESNND